MAGVEVHSYVREVELLECVRNALTVAGGGSLACCEVDVSDEVREGVRLNDQGDGNLGVLLDDSNNGWDRQQGDVGSLT